MGLPTSKSDGAARLGIPEVTNDGVAEDADGDCSSDDIDKFSDINS